MTTRLRHRWNVMSITALALALFISGTAQTDGGPPAIGDIGIHRAEVHEIALFADIGAVSLMFSPDSRVLACGLNDGRVLLLTVVDGGVQRELTTHAAAVTSVNFSPDGRWLASSGEDGWVHITDLVDERATLSLPHRGIVHEVEFSPRGTYLGTVGEERRLRLWDVATWSELPAIEGHTNTVFALAISPAEDLIVTGSGGSDPSVRLWNLLTGEELRRDLYEGVVHDIEYSPRSRDRHATVCGTQPTIWIWDVDEGEYLHIIGPFWGATTDAAYSSLGNTLVAVSEDRTLLFTTMPAWTAKRSVEFDEPLVAVAFSPSRQYIACSDTVGHIYLLYIPE